MKKFLEVPGVQHVLTSLQEDSWLTNVAARPNDAGQAA